jgi:hypothetical protein
MGPTLGHHLVRLRDVLLATKRRLDEPAPLIAYLIAIPSTMAMSMIVTWFLIGPGAK